MAWKSNDFKEEMFEDKINAHNIKSFIEKSGYLLSDLDFTSFLEFDYCYIVEENQGLSHFIKPNMESVVRNDNAIETMVTLTINTKDTYFVTIFDPSFLIISIDPSTTAEFASFEITKQHMMVHLKVIKKTNF